MISAKKNSISAADNPKRIVVVLPKDRAMEIAEKIHIDKKIDTCNIHRGRGRSTAVMDSVSYGNYAEVDVISVIVDANRADEIFEFIFFEAEINKPHGGFIYQLPVEKSSFFQIPDLTEVM